MVRDTKTAGPKERQGPDENHVRTESRKREKETDLRRGSIGAPTEGRDEVVR